MPKVSVIIPCYNVEKYITQCIDSLLNQTMHDIEIICIDDKSPDNVLDVLHTYAARDSRIKVIEQPQNGGVSVARNAGIEAATGEYISFVDPDDYVEKNFFERLYNKATAENLDICVSNICEHLCDGTTRKHSGYAKRAGKNRVFFNYIQCAAIFKTEFIRKNNLRVPVGITNGEDTVFCIMSAVYCNKIGSIPSVYYHYLRRDDSAERQFYTEKQVESRIKMAHAIVDFLNTIPDLPKHEYQQHFGVAFGGITTVLFTKTTVKEFRIRACEEAIEIFKQCKHPDMFNKRAEMPYLQCADAYGLYKHLQDNHVRDHTTRITLFKKIPLVTIHNTMNRKKIRILGIPCIYIFY